MKNPYSAKLNENPSKKYNDRKYLHVQHNLFTVQSTECWKRSSLKRQYEQNKTKQELYQEPAQSTMSKDRMISLQPEEVSLSFPTHLGNG